MRARKLFGSGPQLAVICLLILPSLLVLADVLIGALSNWDVSGSSSARFPTVGAFVTALTGGHRVFIIQQILRSCLVASADVLIALPAAHFFTRRIRPNLRLVLLMMLLLPFFMNGATRAFSWTTLLSAQGPVGLMLQTLHASDEIQRALSYGPVAIFLNLVSSSLPLVFFCVAARMVLIKESVWKLSDDVGLGWGSELLLLAYPVSRLGVLSGWIVGFVVSTLASSEVDFSSGGSQMSLTRSMQHLFGARNPNAAMAIAVVVMFFSVIIIWGAGFASNRIDKIHLDQPIPGGLAWLWIECSVLVATFAITLGPATFVLSETAHICFAAFMAHSQPFDDLLTDGRIPNALQNTIAVAGLVTIPAVIIGSIVGLSWWEEKTFQKLFLATIFLAAIPGDVYSMGVYFIARRLGDLLSPLVLIAVAQLPFVFPFVLLTIVGGYMKLGRGVLVGAKDLGVAPWRIFFYVVLRTSWPEIVLSGMVGIVLSVNDIARASMILQSHELISGVIAGKLVSGWKPQDFILASMGVCIGIMMVSCLLFCVMFSSLGRSSFVDSVAGRAPADH